MSTATHILVTGANRGLGLAFARLYLQEGATVFAAARQPEKSDGLKQLKEQFSEQLFSVTMDVTDEGSVQRALDEVGAETTSLDILINNAGWYDRQEDDGPEALDLAEIEKSFAVNTLGPCRVTRHALPLLRQGQKKKLIHITSLMGSIEDNTSGGSYGYRMSKAALNMLSKNLAKDLAPDRIVSVLLHPGWVRTDMGGPHAPLDIDTSVRGMMQVIANLTKGDTGTFLRYDGAPAPY